MDFNYKTKFNAPVSIGGLNFTSDEVSVSSGNVVRFCNDDGDEAVSLQFTDSSSGGVLQIGSSSTNTAISSLTGGNISIHSGTSIMLSAGDVNNPTMKLEITPTAATLNGVDLLTGSGGGGGEGVTEEWVQGNFVPLNGDFTTSGAGTFSGVTTFNNEVNVLNGKAIRFRDDDGNAAVSIRFTDSPTGGVLNQGSATSMAAMTWMSGNYMSWFSSEFVRLYSGKVTMGMISPTSKVEANPNGVILSAGAGDAAKIVIDAGKIQVGGVALTLNVGPTASNHAATKGYVDDKIAAIGGGTTADVYTKSEVDKKLALKADAADVYTKSEVDKKLSGITIDPLSQAEYDGLANKDPETLYVITD